MYVSPPSWPPSSKYWTLVVHKQFPFQNTDRTAFTPDTNGIVLMVAFVQFIQM